MRVTTSHPHTPPTGASSADPANEPANPAAVHPPRSDNPTRRGEPNQPARAAERPADRPPAHRTGPLGRAAALPRRAAASSAPALMAVLITVLMAVLLLAGAEPALAHAAEPTVSAVLAQGQTGGQVEQIIDRATDWLMALLAALATLFLTIGGIRYILANGNPSEVEHAKQALRNAGIGYGLAALAPLIVDILAELVAR